MLVQNAENDKFWPDLQFLYLIEITKFLLQLNVKRGFITCLLIEMLNWVGNNSSV